MTRGYNFHKVDQIPQDVFDRVLWHAVHGPASPPPPPGPNAEPGQ